MVTPRQQRIQNPGFAPGTPEIDPVDYRRIVGAPPLGGAARSPLLNPRDYVSTYADFGNGNMPPDWSLTNVGLGSGVAVLTGERNGAMQLASGTTNSGYTLVSHGSQTILPWLTARDCYFEGRIALTTALGTAATRHIGFWNDFTAAAPADGFGFRTLGGTANWFAVTRSGGSETTTDTGIAAVTGTWYLFVMGCTMLGTIAFFEIWSDAYPRVRLFGPVRHTANITTAALAMGLRTMNPDPAEGATRDIAIDYGYGYQYRQTRAA